MMDGRVLEQKALLKFRWRFELMEDDAIHVTAKRQGNRSEYRINLSELSATTRRQKQTEYSHLVVATVLAVACGTALTSAWFLSRPVGRGGDEPHIGASILGGAFALGAIVWFLKWIRSSLDVVIFDNLVGGPSLIIMWEKPDSGQFNMFLDEVRKRIVSAAPAPNTGLQGSLAKQITELAELKDRGVLSAEEFKNAKARLLGGEERVGF